VRFGDVVSNHPPDPPESPDTVTLRKCQAELARRSKRCDDWAADLADERAAHAVTQAERNALQARVALAVAALKSGKHIEVCISEALEALL
jgi:anthranilate/para-aminobenzoate synthase component I